MPTTLKSVEPKSASMTMKSGIRKRKAIHLKTWLEAEKYFKDHLKPIGYSPKGQPIYAHDDIAALNVILPEDFGV